MESHDDLPTLEMAASWDDLQLPVWVDEYDRQLYGRPARPPPETVGGGKAGGGKKKKKSVARATDGL